MSMILNVFYPFGIDLFCLEKKFLVLNLLSRNLKIKYRRSVFGLLWTLLNPLGISLVYYFVFKMIFKIRVENYGTIVMTGMICWTFFIQTIVEGMESISGNKDLVSKIPIPLNIFPYVGMLTYFTTFLLAIPVMAVMAAVMGVHVGPYVVTVLLLGICLMQIAYSLSLLLAISFAYFGDLKHIMVIFAQVWFYATPVVYNESMVPKKFKLVVILNPVGKIFSAFQRVIVQGLWPTLGQVSIIFAWTVGLTLAAALAHRVFHKQLVEQL